MNLMPLPFMGAPQQLSGGGGMQQGPPGLPMGGDMAPWHQLAGLLGPQGGGMRGWGGRMGMHGGGMGRRMKSQPGMMQPPGTPSSNLSM